MAGNGIKINTPPTDAKSVNGIFCLLNDYGFPISGLPTILTPKFVASQVQNGEIMTIENGGAIIGAITVYKIEQSNDFGSFNLVFDRKINSTPETIAAAIQLFKEYYQKRGLTKITVLLPDTDKITGKILLANNFEEEHPLQSQLKVPSGFLDLRRFTASANGRQIIPATQLPVSQEKIGVIQNLHTQLEKAAEELQKTKNAKILVENNLTRANEEIALKIEEIKGLRISLASMPETEKDQKIRELKSEIEALKKEATDEKEQRVKFKEWLDEKREKLKIAEEKIRLLETELEKSKNEALEKKIPEKTTRRKTKKLSDIAIRILEVVNEQGPEGITQKEIVAKTGIQQGTVSYTVTKVLLPADLVKEVATSKKRTKIAPNAEKNKEISNLLLERKKPLELADTIQKVPKSEEVKQEEKEETQQPISEHEGDPDTSPANDDKKLIVIEELPLTAEEKVLDSVLDDNLIEKGLNEMVRALEDGKWIKASDLGSHCKVKKKDIEILVSLLCKSINWEAKRKNKNAEPPIKLVMIHHLDDYEQTEIEINPEIEAELKKPATDNGGSIKQKMGKVLTPFERMVEILHNQTASNGDKINIVEIRNKAAEEGLTKDEADAALRALKRNEVIIPGNEIDFYQIDIEKFAKI